MNTSPIEQLSQAISEEMAVLRGENAELKESLGEAMASLRWEDRSWLKLFGLDNFDRMEGLSIKEVQEIAERMRVKTALGGLYKRGADLHTGYVWAHGINIPGVEAGASGRPSALRAFYERNYEELFSTSAHGELQKCRYTDGNVLALCIPGEKVRFIPFSEIVNVKVNPDFPSEIWAYLREWTPDGDKPEKTKQLWYYTKRYTGRKQGSYQTGGKAVSVSPGVIVDKGFNKQKGWVLGIPDVAAAAPWIEAYNEIMQYGRVVNEALSKILYKIISPTKKAAQNASAKVAGMKGHGKTVSTVEGAEVSAISTAGKGYDFTSARPVGAEAASALNVQLMELLADTSAAGSSYGSAQALVPSVLNAMGFIQNEWIDFYTEIFRAYSIPVPEMSFDDIVAPDFYRQAQGITLLSTALSDVEYRAQVLDLLNIDGNSATIPPTLAARSIAAKAQASPDQGNQSASAGGVDSGQANDQRTDLVSEAFKAFQIDELRELVERLEAVKAQN